MKRIVSLLLALAVLLSMTACGGSNSAAPASSSIPEKPANSSAPAASTPASSAAAAPASAAPAEKPASSIPEKPASSLAPVANADGKSIVVWYGANYYGIHEETFYCPEGAYIDESDLEDYKEKGSVSSFNVYDDVRDYSATAKNYWSRELSAGEAAVYEIAPQLYFYGKLDEKNAQEYDKSSQNVTKLGLKWNDKEIMLIETEYTSKSGWEYDETFIGVEVEERYWRTKEGGGVEENLTAPILLGFVVDYKGWDDITIDRYTWLAGQLFGVESGKSWPVAGEAETAPAPVANVNASEIIGTWLERDSDWDNTYIFNADGTGLLISGPEYPFTYAVSANVLTLTYDDDDKEDFTITVNGNLITMVDKWGDELLLDKKAEEVKEPEKVVEPEKPAKKNVNPYEKEILGKWAAKDSEYLETFSFNADGTGTYTYTEGELYTFTYKYNFLRRDYVQIFYDDDGSEDGFQIRIEGDTMYATNMAVVDMPLIRQK